MRDELAERVILIDVEGNDLCVDEGASREYKQTDE